MKLLFFGFNNSFLYIFIKVLYKFIDTHGKLYQVNNFVCMRKECFEHYHYYYYYCVGA